MPATNLPRRLIGEVQLFRIRVATAESRLKLLREAARLARRRRKEAKRIAQRARKQFKRGKADVAELKEALARAETKLFEAGGRELARKLAKPVPVRKRRAGVSNKSSSRVRKPEADLPAVARVLRKATRKNPAVSDRANRVALEPDPAARQISETESMSYEQRVPGHEQEEAEEQKI